MKKKKEDCSNCYIEYNELHYFRGIVFVIGLSMGLMIPILNIFICKFIFNSAREHDMKDFWDGCFYDYIKKRVKS